MVGAIVGINNIPDHMTKTLLSFDCLAPQTRNKRPEFLSVRRYAVAGIERLLELRYQQ